MFYFYYYILVILFLNVIRYTNVETGRSFELLAGLYYSTFTAIWEDEENETKKEAKAEDEGNDKKDKEDTKSEDSDPKREKDQDKLYPFLSPQFGYITREVSNDISHEFYLGYSFYYLLFQKVSIIIYLFIYFRYLESLPHKHKSFMKEMYSYLSLTIVLCGRTEKKQKMELLAQLVEQWCEYAEEDNAIVDMIGIVMINISLYIYLCVCCQTSKGHFGQIIYT